MSCILYSKGSYSQLAKSHTFQVFFREYLNSYYESPAKFAEALFELNAQAYKDRYQCDDSEVEGARADNSVEPKFASFVKSDMHSTRPLAYALLYNLLRSVDYQCSDAHDYHTLQTGWHLDWITQGAARKMADYLEDQFTNASAA